MQYALSPEKRTLRIIYLLEQGTQCEDVAAKELDSLVEKANEKGYDVAYPSEKEFELLKRMMYVEERGEFLRLKRTGRIVAKGWRAEKELEDLVGERVREMRAKTPAPKWWESVSIYWPFG